MILIFPKSESKFNGQSQLQKKYCKYYLEDTVETMRHILAYAFFPWALGPNLRLNQSTISSLDAHRFKLCP